MSTPLTSSLWHDTAGPAGAPARPALDADTEADVVIVGAGLTGLWTAWYLAARRPQWRIVVLDAETAGFGASGRNGGWCSALLPMSLDSIATAHGQAAAHHAQQAMDATVDEVAAVVAAERIDCDLAKGGTLHVARSAVQAARLRAEVDHHHAFGFGDDDVCWLDAAATEARIGIDDALGAVSTRQCAALHPAKLVAGLANAVERRGVTIHERTRVDHVERGRVRAGRRTIRTRFTVRATEAFTAGLPGLKRALVPIYSLMIATEPLPADVLATIGLERRETFTDGRRLVIYGQRTADGRIAFGGRGAPYHYASRMRADYEHDGAVHERLRATLVELFPVLADATITHRWGGAVAAARDWWCSIGLDRANGIAWAGGYVGDGVATTNLAGRTLAELLTGERSALCELPWVDHRSKHWEARAVALAGRQRDGPPDRPRRPLRDPHRQGRPLAWPGDRPPHQPVISRSCSSLVRSRRRAATRRRRGRGRGRRSRRRARRSRRSCVTSRRCRPPTGAGARRTARHRSSGAAHRAASPHRRR
ncbi:MAG: FAD-dependent oxidoreductase [Ilumatobacteraceae bacterium]